MPENTPTYKLEYFKRGSAYSGASDLRRFLTVDYNLESYVGIVGVGIISGWTIEDIGSLQVQILPGTGIINGYYSESEYQFKRRSEMVSGEREVEIVEDDDIPEPYLTTSQRAVYVAIVQEYNPSYNPVGPIENSYVKVVVPEVLTLADNSDTYILAELVHSNPYPAMVNYPEIGDQPVASSYATYAEYQADVAIYNAQLTAIHNYKWRNYVENHFTSVEFSLSSSYIKSSSKVLIGKVITRNGLIKEIDTSQVDSLANIDAPIREKARLYIANHNHGGNKSYDPPQVNLTTDVRPAALASYNNSTQMSVFNILEKSSTSISLGHNHSYKIDSEGNGYTVGVNGSDIIHFHKITSFIVGNQEYSSNSINTHIHTISSTIDEIDTNSSYVVYINGVPATSNVSVDLTKKTISISGLMGEIYRTYYTSLIVNTLDGESSTYTYEQSSYNIFNYMIKMMVDFNTKYPSDQTIVENSDGTIDSSRNPFVFTTDNNEGIAGIGDVISQSSIAQTLMNNVGDVFTFTPNAARNVDVSLSATVNTSASDYDVKIELLGNTEVTGILKEENIVFVNAEKFAMGTFEIARLPPLNHMGRMGEEFLPFQYPLVSSDGIGYFVSPAITTTILDHYHKTNFDETVTGTTKNTYVSEDPVYYAYANSTSYLIAHTHGVSNGTVLDASGRDMAAWQNALYGTNASAVHTHSIIYPIKSDPKVVYSIAETPSGSILAGTSNGLYIIPNDEAYLFVVNGEKIYQIGNDLWNLLLSTKTQYELLTGKELVVNEDLYLSQITLAQSNLVLDGDSYLITGYIDPVRGQDTIMIQRVDYFLLPFFKYQETKLLNEVSDDETVIDVQLVYPDGTTVTQEDIIESEKDPESSTLDNVVELATIEKFMHNVPVWSIVANPNGDIFINGANTYSKISDIENNLYSLWSFSNKPSQISVLRKIYQDTQENVWIPTEGGMLIARYYQNGNVIEATNNFGFAIDVNDVVEGSNGKIYSANSSGISLSENYGKSWVSVLSINEGCSKVIKDASNKLFAVTKNSDVYSSENGNIWILVGSLPSGEIADIIIYNGYFYVCFEDGLYRSSTNSMGSWSKVLNIKPYSLGLSQGLGSILVGCDQIIYESVDGVTFQEVINIMGSSSPSIFTNNTRKNFGYAYSQSKQQFLFKELTYSEDPFSALIDFNIWMAKDGSWNNNSLYDIYIDSRMAYSTKKNIDNREEYNYNFSIDPSQGTLDFGANTNLTIATEIYSNYISVENSSGFLSGDRIYVVCTSPEPTKPVKPELKSDWISYYSDLEAYYQNKFILENMYFYAEISEVSSGKIFLDRNIDKIINVPAKVYKIPNLSGSTPIFSNIYDSMFSNIGVNTHESLDDKMTYITDSRPYLLNNSYLSNLLQLTQAIKYVYPDIDYGMINEKFFDFRYSWIPSDSNYIGDIIDLPNSEIYNEGFYDSNFAINKSKTINRILIGHGFLDGMIIVATDIGIFYAKIEDALESNWFYTHNLTKRIFDIDIFNEITLIAATEDGMYYSTNLIDWTKDEQPSIDLPIYTMAYRWTGRETVKIDSHTAILTNVNGNGIIMTSSPIYGLIEANRIIRITNAGEKSGDYNVLSSTTTSIVVSGEFPGVEESFSGIVIEMGAWWEYLFNDVSPNNPNIKNTLLAGGKNMIVYATNASSNTSTWENIIWHQSLLPSDISQFTISDIQPINNGINLASAVGTNKEENNLLSCDGSGQQWTHFIDLKSVKGIINGKEITDMGHTTLKVTYTYPQSFLCEDNSLNLKEVGFFNGKILLMKSYVCSNEQRKGNNYITINGQEIIDFINSYPNLTFTIYPVKINKITQSSDNNVFYGTNMGLYFDEGTVVNNFERNGETTKVGQGGIVVKIDINGTISSVNSNNHVVLSVKTSDEITTNQLVGYQLYVIDLSSPSQYKIISNASKGTTGEITIELDTPYTSLWDSYRTKKVTIVGNQSNVYVSFDSPVASNQFQGGKIYISSNENDNFGKFYDISSNTETYLTLSTIIVPRSSFSANNDSLIVGQSLKIMDSTNRIKLFAIFDNSIELNQLIGYTFTPYSGRGAIPYFIYSNTPYEIVLEPINISDLDIHPVLYLQPEPFFVSGKGFRSFSGFNNKYTTITSDHYHYSSLIGQSLTGTINSITTNGTGYMDLVISDTSGFDNSIVANDGTIIENCKVYLYNPSNMSYSYETLAVSYVGSILKLKTYNPDIWDTTSYSESQISSTWKFSIETQYNGITNNTIYHNFNALTQYLTQDLMEGDNEVWIQSTSGINSGDKIQIVDVGGRSFNTRISSVVSLQKIIIENNSNNTFTTLNSSAIKVLRDTFTNNHVHRIKNAQIETLVISEYALRGYPSVHYHRLAPYIQDISDIALSDSDLLVVGSGENIFIGYNSGNGWKLLTNLNNSLEWNEEIEGISRIIIGDEKTIAGTTNGQIFSNTSKEWTNVPLENPL